MRTPTRVGLSVLVLAALAIAGCNPPAESVEVKEPVAGPPDLVNKAPANPANRAFQLHAFHLNQVWSAAPRQTTSGPHPRAKITVWDYADAKTPVAELYFEDVGQENSAANPDPAKATRPYQLHFPISTFGPILGTLRNTNEPVFLYYYDGTWCFGTYTAEPVGID